MIIILNCCSLHAARQVRRAPSHLCSDVPTEAGAGCTAHAAALWRLKRCSCTWWKPEPKRGGDFAQMRQRSFPRFHLHVSRCSFFQLIASAIDLDLPTSSPVPGKVPGL